MRGVWKAVWKARSVVLVGAIAVLIATIAASAGGASPVAAPKVIWDMKTGSDKLGSLTRPGPDPIQDYVQPDTQIEPSIAVNPANPRNVVTAYQEGRIADGGDATNGFATSMDGGKTWKTGELPGLTTYPHQGGAFERASDAVVAFGPNNVVYANSLVFDLSTGNGLRSGIAINVSKDGGLHWSPPVVFQDDQLGGLNDKNWIVVDMSKAPGHHYGRVYAVWDRVAPVVYDYCDQNCDSLSNWLPNLKTIPGLVFPGQGIGAYPVITKGGGLGIVMDATSGGVPIPKGSSDELDVKPGTDELVFIAAPAAGSTPFPAPLAFVPPVDIATNQSAGVPSQRAGGLPAAAVDPTSGTIYAVWEDGRLRHDGTNDAVMSRSFNNGVTWTPVQRINPGSTTDHVDHYNVTVAVGAAGSVHVAYRTRNESGKGPRYGPVIDTYYQESTNGGSTFIAPLKVDSTASNAFFDAFSRDGSFEGDYNEITSAVGFTYVVRCQGEPAFAGEPPALTPNPAGTNTLVLTKAGKGHQHQSAWVALIR